MSNSIGYLISEPQLTTSLFSSIRSLVLPFFSTFHVTYNVIGTASISKNWLPVFLQLLLVLINWSNENKTRHMTKHFKRFKTLFVSALHAILIVSFVCLKISFFFPNSYIFGLTQIIWWNFASCFFSADSWYTAYFKKKKNRWHVFHSFLVLRWSQHTFLFQFWCVSRYLCDILNAGERWKNDIAISNLL